MSGELDMLVRQATGVAKAPYVASFVRLLLEAGENVVLFGWHREVYDIWLAGLASYNPRLYTGTESPTAKQEAVDQFRAGQCRVLIVSLRSGAGLDGLQDVCSTCVFGELDWSPAVHEQCIGRVHRDGQGRGVMAYFLVADEGSDPFVCELLGMKRSQVEGIRGEVSELKQVDHAAAVRAMAARYLEAKHAAV